MEQTTQPTISPEIEERLARFIKLNEFKADLKAQERAVNDEIEQLSEWVLDLFSQLGVKNMRKDGRTIYIYTARHVKRNEEVTIEQGRDILMAEGMTDCMSILTSKIGALLREDPEQVPERVREVWDIEETFQVKVRKST